MTTTNLPTLKGGLALKFEEVSYQPGIVQIDFDLVSFDYPKMLSISPDIKDATERILSLIGAKDVSYNIEQKGEIIYIYIRKNILESFQTTFNFTIKKIIFVFTSETNYLIEPLLRLDLSKKESTNNIYYIIPIIIIIILIIGYVIYKKFH